MKKIFQLTSMVICLMAIASCESATTHNKTVQLTILGNCDMCKNTIEAAGSHAGQYETHWDKDSQIAQIIFDSNAVTLDHILRAIADVGYDNTHFRATNEAYNQLHECCQYDRTISHSNHDNP